MFSPLGRGSEKAAFLREIEDKSIPGTILSQSQHIADGQRRREFVPFCLPRTKGERGGIFFPCQIEPLSSSAVYVVRDRRHHSAELKGKKAKQGGVSSGVDNMRGREREIKRPPFRKSGTLGDGRERIF